MMEIQINDIFSQYNHVYNTIALFKVVTIENRNIVRCLVYMQNRIVGDTLEYKSTLFKMQKLSSLEKELM